MAPARREFIIGPRDVPIVVGWNGPTEAVSQKIQLVTLAKIIRLRERIEVCQHRRVDAKIQGIHCLDLIRSQGRDKTEGWIVNDIHFGVSCRAIGITRGATILNHALTKIVAWHDAEDAGLLALPRALIIDKEEKTILADGPAERSAEDVADKLGGDIRL